MDLDLDLGEDMEGGLVGWMVRDCLEHGLYKEGKVMVD